MQIQEIIKVKRGVYALKMDDIKVEVGESQLVKYHLYKGQTLDASLIKKLEKEWMDSQCLHKAIDILSRRNHFIKELEVKLKQRDFEDSVIETTIRKLMDEKYLNELETAQQFVNAKSDSDSQMKIRMKLKQRGCPESILQMVVQDDSANELKKAILAGEKKARQLKDQVEIKKKEKIIRHLMGKGFDYQTARKAYEELK